MSVILHQNALRADGFRSAFTSVDEASKLFNLSSPDVAVSRSPDGPHFEVNVALPPNKADEAGGSREALARFLSHTLGTSTAVVISGQGETLPIRTSSAGLVVHEEGVECDDGALSDALRILLGESPVDNKIDPALQVVIDRYSDLGVELERADGLHRIVITTDVSSLGNEWVSELLQAVSDLKLQFLGENIQVVVRPSYSSVYAVLTQELPPATLWELVQADSGLITLRIEQRFANDLIVQAALRKCELRVNRPIQVVLREPSIDAVEHIEPKLGRALSPADVKSELARLAGEVPACLFSQSITAVGCSVVFDVACGPLSTELLRRLRSRLAPTVDIFVRYSSPGGHPHLEEFGDALESFSHLFDLRNSHVTGQGYIYSLKCDAVTASRQPDVQRSFDDVFQPFGGAVTLQFRESETSPHGILMDWLGVDRSWRFVEKVPHTIEIEGDRLPADTVRQISVDLGFDLQVRYVERLWGEAIYSSSPARRWLSFTPTELETAWRNADEVLREIAGAERVDFLGNRLVAQVPLHEVPADFAKILTEALSDLPVPVVLVSVPAAPLSPSLGRSISRTLATQNITVISAEDRGKALHVVVETPTPTGDEHNVFVGALSKAVGRPVYVSTPVMFERPGSYQELLARLPAPFQRFVLDCSDQAGETRDIGAFRKKATRMFQGVFSDVEPTVHIAQVSALDDRRVKFTSGFAIGDPNSFHEDAITVEIADDNSVTLAIHILDASATVPAGSLMDLSARSMGTSWYATKWKSGPGSRCRLFPNNLIRQVGFRPDRECRAVSPSAYFSPSGDFIGTRIVPSLVRVSRCVPYDEVNSLLAPARVGGGRLSWEAETFARALSLLSKIENRRTKPGRFAPSSSRGYAGEIVERAVRFTGDEVGAFLGARGIPALYLCGDFYLSSARKLFLDRLATFVRAKQIPARAYTEATFFEDWVLSNLPEFRKKHPELAAHALNVIRNTHFSADSTGRTSRALDPVAPINAPFRNHYAAANLRVLMNVLLHGGPPFSLNHMQCLANSANILRNQGSKAAMVLDLISDALNVTEQTDLTVKAISNRTIACENGTVLTLEEGNLSALKPGSKVRVSITRVSFTGNELFGKLIAA